MSKALSLHVGVNEVDGIHYANGWKGPLDAPEQDAKDMEALAKGLGYEARRLLTVDATREKVIGAIKDAAASLEPEGIFLLTYSGHGGQMPDQPGGDEEDDFKDETWCLYDGELIDDELNELWALFGPTIRILVLSDSCHSGSVIRAGYADLDTRPSRKKLPQGHPALTYKGMDPKLAIQTYEENQAFYDAIRATLPEKPSKVSCAVRLISACQDNQSAEDGDPNSLFTAKVKDVWAKGAFNGNYGAFFDAIVKRSPPQQTPEHYLVGRVDEAFNAQRPFTI